MSITGLRTRVNNYLTGLLFDKVYNEPHRPSNRTYLLRALCETAVKGKLLRSVVGIRIPTTNHSYYVYTLDEVTGRGLDLVVNEWSTLSDAQASRRTQYHIYTNLGLRLSNKYVFGMQSHVDNKFLLAVRADKIYTTSQFHPQLNELFLQVYHDPNGARITTSHLTVTDNQSKINIASVAATVDLIFVNGQLHESLHAGDLETGDEVELVQDPSYGNFFYIDIARETDRVSYISTIDNISRTIIHIPKDSNPGSQVISASFCDIFVFPRNLIHSNTKGTKFLNGSGVYSPKQITHCDFGIADTMLNVQAGMHRTDELVLKVFIRYASNNVLIAESNELDKLYLNTDEEILHQLENRALVQCPSWTAQHLEASPYATLVETAVTNPAAAIDISRATSALGFLNATSLVDQRIFTSVIQVQKRVVIDLPTSMLGRKILPLVYVDGSKIGDDKVTYEYITTRKIQVNIHPGAVRPLDEVTVILHEGSKPYSILITPSIDNSLVVRYKDSYRIYEVTDEGDQLFYLGEHTSVYGYTNLTSQIDSVVNHVSSGGVPYLAIKPSYFGRKLLVKFDTGTTVQSFLIDSLVASGESVTLSIQENINDYSIASSFTNAIRSASTVTTGSGQSAFQPLPGHSDPAKLLSGKKGSEAWDERIIVSSTTQPSFIITPPVGELGQHTLFAYRISFLAGAPSIPTEGDLQASYFDLGVEPESITLTGIPDQSFRVPDAYANDQQVVSWDVLVDGTVVSSIRDFVWTGDYADHRTFRLPTPTVVNSSMEIKLIRSSGTYVQAISQFEPICSTATLPGSSPALVDGKAYAYLNGNYLIEGLDFKVHKLMDGSITRGTFLTLYSKQYLTASNNKLDLYLTSEKTVDTSVGIHGDSAPVRNANANVVSYGSFSNLINAFILKTGLTTLHVGGKLVTPTHPFFGESRVMELHTSIDREAAVVLRNLFTADEFTEWRQITSSSQEEQPVLDAPLPEEVHKMYIPTLTQILSDIDNSLLVLPFDPDARRLVKNLSGYSRSLAEEVIRTTKLDTRYLAFDPSITDSYTSSVSLIEQLRRGIVTG